MKKLSIIVITICVISGLVFSFIYYSKSHTIVLTNISYMNTQDVDTLVKPWVQRQDNKSGMFLGKFSGTGDLSEYYLYINNIKMPEIEINSYGYDGIKINVLTNDNAVEKSEIFRIKELNKKTKYIILNGNKINVSSIEEIK